MSDNAEARDYLLTVLINHQAQAVFIFQDNLLLTANSETLRLIKAQNEGDILGLSFSDFFDEQLDDFHLTPHLPIQFPLTLIGLSQAQRYPATLALDNGNKLLVILASQIQPGPAQHWLFTDLDSSSTLIGHWIYNSATSLLWWESQTYEIFAKSAEQFSPSISTILHLVHPDDKQQVENAFNQAITEQTKIDICHRIITTDGEIRFIRQRATWGSENIELLGTVLDLTDIKQHISHSDHKLRVMDETQRIGHMGSWEFDLLKNEVTWSEQTAELFGIKLEEFDGTIESFQQFILPDDKVNLDVARAKPNNSGIIEAEYRITRNNDGAIRWLFECGKSILNASGQEIRRLGMVIDITERKRLEMIQRLESSMVEAVAESLELPQIMEKIVLGIEEIIPNTIASILLLDEEGKQLLHGSAPNLPNHYNDAIHGEFIGPQTGSCGTAAYLKKPVIVADIEHDPLWANYFGLALACNLRACWSHPIFDEKQNVIATFAVYHNTIKTPEPEQLDTIERISKIISIAICKQRDEQRIRTSESRFREAFQDAATGVAITTTDGRILECNQAYSEMLGYSVEELSQLSFQQLTHPDDIKQNEQQISDILLGIHDSRVMEKRYISKSGDTIWARLSVTSQRDQNDRPIHLLAICENITEIKLAEAKRSEAERSLTQLLRNLPGLAYRCLFDEHWTMLYVSESFKRLTGYEPEEVLNNKSIDFASLIHPDDRQLTTEITVKALQEKQSFQVEYRIIHKDGRIRWFWEQGSGVSNDDGNIELIEGYITDITLQKEADANIRESEQRFQILSKATNDAIWDWNLITNELWWSDNFETLFGFYAEQSKPSFEGWEKRIHPDDRNRVVNNLIRAVAENQQSWSDSYKFRRQDGSYADVIDRGYVIYNHAHQAIRMVGGITDISERLEMEEKLRQSQRLEAVGQLTGGVAHDFNNLLTVIVGNAEIITESLAADSNLRGLSQMIQEAADRGAELIGSLLAFARRQPLDPKHIDTNQLLKNFQSLLSRSLGESIQLELALQADIWLAQVDPGQLENALLNLALNARDAMPSGGRLLIETLNVSLSEDYALQHDVTAGDYVIIGVSDTGIGIAPENLEKVFEPFYTTKSKDKGTGLGLAMVYGFARQSLGHINVYSELGQGTTIRLYLPRSPVEIATAENPAVLPIQPKTGKEHILVVEDDDLVRSYVISQLEFIGYQVTSASNGQEAMEIIQSEVQIDLLFTDVVMPGGMSGRDLSDKAQRLRPQLRVLFTSGYTENSIVHHGRLDPGVMLLSKPYSRDELSSKIHQALD
ncbi:PAS domain-containing protein [Methylophaga sp.]|uniref:PAS domain-containing protein n=1 Tax=Methylophaga sp. TaxID=2024840 RepID=UPI002721D20C|nr:PAS domain-containing protein [Methylophaga sp.]MDO8827076.1 PAS domain-containing protein [Methylophaga sp.]